MEAFQRLRQALFFRLKTVAREEMAPMARAAYRALVLSWMAYRDRLASCRGLAPLALLAALALAAVPHQFP
jgi:hypothetical protein